ncbi:ABC transporter ATP-binding protein [Knoellia aerolata]|uniref:Multidrug ABC transporter ATP-binding protein n=1 Tax=Knoellia aerolata DSM 18566 TaxID=1385519 RepID=A0A0A0JRY4_9MICO|nr:ATP-binding cassette domain-containing protein [Knoellia aerolata]KGN40210.1 multidrug ABC transporter ATP-binding protein [Knoellia aerolata DSM 18566]
MIEIRQLTKIYGRTTAVDGLSFTVRPGVVTGFLGPNGAGKSTTMRTIVGLDRPTGGETLIGGRRYADHPAPMGVVGALLEASAPHPGRSATNHLRALAATHGIGMRRVNDVIGLVGLDDVAGKRAGTFSLGMAQRLGLAAALLGDPAVLILDEPVNGLDPDGIRWIRDLLREFAHEGRTVFISSHLMSEMALTADHLVVIGKGRLLADVPMADMIAAAGSTVRVKSPRAADLAPLLAERDVEVTAEGPDVFVVAGSSSADIAETAFTHGIVLHELTPMQVSLEDAYMALTREHIQYQAGDGPDENGRAVA